MNQHGRRFFGKPNAYDPNHFNGGIFDSEPTAGRYYPKLEVRLTASMNDTAENKK